MQVMQCLWFERDAEAAVRFYTSLIPGSSIQSDVFIPMEAVGGPAAGARVIDFTLGGQRLQAMETPGPERFNHAVSMVVECEDQAEVDRLWEALGEGGQIEQCGWLRDRGGLCWQIVPRRLNELMHDPDAARVERVTAAMLRMVKLDVAELEAAAAASS